MADEMTREDADRVLAMYAPNDLAQALDQAARHGADPVWRAALDRARARERYWTRRAGAAASAGDGATAGASR